MRAAVLAVLLLAVVACGGSDDEEPLTVFAAASLTETFEELAPTARFNFAASDELATQLREGARADVYAAASERYADALAEEGIVDRPLVFATNRILLIVPRDNPAGIKRLRDVARPGVRLVVAAAGVPVGDYTREGLRRVGLGGALENVVSEEDDVKGVLAKVRLGEADAGFVYQTDGAAARDDVIAVQLLSDLQARYAAAVVRGSERPDDARAFVRLLQSPRGVRLLRDAGFGIP
jgi:molybdate transport system substrate-binding protein